MSFKDKVVIVTGASSGIGAAIATSFSAEGASVVLVGRNEANLAKTTVNLPRALSIKADVTNDADAKKIIDETIKKFGKIDVLINNAGGTDFTNIFDENIMKSFDFMINLNLRSVFRITSLAIPHLIKTKGNIVNMSSIAGHTTRLMSEIISYCVAKAGLSRFSACLSADLAPHGVRVNTVCPGPVDTNFLENSNSPQPWDNFKGITSLNKVSEPQEIADLVLFISSNKARSITGSKYFCDNGFMAKRF